jgi:hypothetical protein
LEKNKASKVARFRSGQKAFRKASDSQTVANLMGQEWSIRQQFGRLRLWAGNWQQPARNRLVSFHVDTTHVKYLDY